MPYHLKPGETVPENIRRIVQEEVDAAVAALKTEQPAERGDAIHETRKGIKKIRGLLRLLQPELGRKFRAENSRLRETGRNLSEIRDAYAVVEVFDAVVGRFENQIRTERLQSIRKALEERRREIEASARGVSSARNATSVLQGLARRVKTWPLKTDGFEAIAAGLKRSYRLARRALARVKADPQPDNYHDFRKRVKDHWYHIRLLENVWNGPMEARENSLKDLQDWLGDDHNLVVLREIIESEPRKYGKGAEAKLIVSLFADVQEELRRNSLSLGERLFEDKPRHFRESMERLWKAWKHQPESFTDAQEDKPVLPRKTAPSSPRKKPQVA